MSIFSSILQKLGLQKKDAAPAAPAVTPAKPAAPVAPTAKASTPVKSAAATVKPAEPTFTPNANFHPNAISEVDVVAHLEKLAAGSPGLDWKVSIVDLMKLLGLDSSLAARKELATELGCPADAMADSARMNVWLHKTVLKKVAENGGNIPQSLL